MGNRDSVQQEIEIYQPKINGFKKYQGINGFTIWKNNQKKIQIMSAKTSLFSQKELLTMIDNFKLRHQNHFLVSTLYIKCQDNSSCGGWFQTTIFYQRVFTNLSRIKDIPFLDSLHFYAVAFRGFQMLFRMFGYFEIYQDMFHICQDGKLKVWCNKDISKNQPQNYLKDQYGTQFDMIRKIIFIIDENTDQSNAPFIMKDKLNSYGSRNFEMVKQSLREICLKNGLNVPERLQCLAVLPTNQVQMILDLYSVNKSYQNTCNNSQSIINILNHPTQNNSKNFQNNNNSNSNYFNNNQQSFDDIKRRSNQQNINNMEFTFQKQKQIRNSRSAPHYQNNKPYYNYNSYNHYTNPTFVNQKMDYKHSPNNLNLNSNPSRPHFSFKNFNANNINNYRANNGSNELKIMQLRPQSAQNYNSNNYSRIIGVPMQTIEPIPIFNHNNQNNQMNKNLNFSNSLAKSSVIVNKTGLNLNLTRNNQKNLYGHENKTQSNIRYVTLPSSRNKNIIQQNNANFGHSHYRFSKKSQNDVNYLKKDKDKTHNLVVKFNTKSPNSYSVQKVYPYTYLNSNNQANLDRFKNAKINHGNLIKSSHINQQQSNFQTFDPNKYVNNLNHDQEQTKLRTRRPSSQSKNRPNYHMQNLQNKNNKNQHLFLQTTNLNNRNSSIQLKQRQSINQNQEDQKNLLSKTQTVQILSKSTKTNFKNQLNQQIFQSPALSKKMQQKINSYFENNSINNSKITQISKKQIINNNKGKYIQKFDPNLNILQSFASSKFGTQNSLKSGENQSRVLQIIGRERKDSQTSAFRKDSFHVDIIREQSGGEGDINNSKSSQSGIHNISSSQNLYTDPKILQILKKAKTNKNQTTLKKGFKNHNFYVMSPKIQSNRPFDNLKEIQQKFICDLPSIKNMQDHNISGTSFNNQNYSQNRKQIDSQAKNNKSRFYNQDQLNINSNNQKQKSRPLLNNIIKVGQTPQRDRDVTRNGEISEFYHYDLDKKETSNLNVNVNSNMKMKDYLKVGYQYSKVTTKTQQNSRSYANNNMNLNSIQELASLQKELSNGFAKKQQMSKIRQQTIKNKQQKVHKKYYNPEIDESIFADLIRLRNDKKK